MKETIKTLENIGQTTSLKQHADIKEMLEKLSLSQTLIGNTNIIKKEYICGLVPEDDGEDSDDDEQE